MQPDTPTPPPAPRERVDVRTLPVWQQYAIAVAIVLVVVGIVVLSWQAGHAPDPEWLAFLNTFLVPYAGWIGIAALAFVVGRHLLRRRKAR